MKHRDMDASLSRWRSRMLIRGDRERQYDVQPWHRDLPWHEYVALWKRETDKVIADGLRRAKAGL